MNNVNLVMEVTSFQFRLVLNKINDNETRYDIIIDSPKINMYDLQAIAKVENDDESSLPSLGILEDESFFFSTWYC